MTRTAAERRGGKAAPPRGHLRSAATGFVIAGALAAASGRAAAFDLHDRLAVGAQAGTAGPGVEALISLDPRFVIRGAIEGFRAGGRIDTPGASYAVDARWLTDSGMVDIHPTGSPWLASVGAYYGYRKLRLRGEAADLGAIGGRARLSGFAPFAAIGWDNTFHGARRWGLKARAGLIFSSRPDVELRAAEPSVTDPARAAALQRQEVAVRRDLRAARAWPLVEAGLNYRF
jgi:hypothetical protein